MRYHLHIMLRLFNSRLFGKKLEEVPAALVAAACKAFSPAVRAGAREKSGASMESTLLTTLGWLSAGMGAVAVGLFVGRELRQRYKFNRRTPYDFYSHSGDEVRDIEFGLGI